MAKTLTKEALLFAIQSDDPDTRTEAWLAAGSVGAPAIPALGRLVVEGEHEVSLAARRALWEIARHVGTLPTTDRNRRMVLRELVALLEQTHPALLRREVLWMVSEIGLDAPEIEATSALLKDPDLREDARCALERIPGGYSLAALKRGLEEAPEDFKMNIVQSLRARGVSVPGFPCKKMAPTKAKTG